jgi:hypothetical protein
VKRRRKPGNAVVVITAKGFRSTHEIPEGQVARLWAHLNAVSASPEETKP